MTTFEARFALEGGVCDVEVEGINTRDSPDFVDAFVSYAVWAKSLEELTDAELDALNDDYDFVYEQIMNHIY